MDMGDREQQLGFKPQREIGYNKLLPYSDKLDAESMHHLAEIKAHLGRTVQMRDIKIGATHWTGQLSKYIKLYGLKFSKEDHINFIHLLFDLTTIPDLELPMVGKFGNILFVLLKKRELITRDDLVLPWRPLYELLDKVAFNKYEQHWLQIVPRNLDNLLKCIIKECRLYFPLEATAEMLLEWRPLMCPYDMTMIRATSYFSLFLPTHLPLEHSDKGYKLWFEEFMTLWDMCQNNPSWEGDLVSLFTRLACENIGYIDWEPYMAKIFTRILRSLSLPVGGGKITIGHSNSHPGYDLIEVAWWISSMLGGGSSCQKHLTKLFKALESFFHPSNHGKWVGKLMRLMIKLAQNLVKRTFREKGNKHWCRPIPDSHKLSSEEVTEFVESMKPIVFLAMFSKVGSHHSSIAINQLALLRPEIIIPPLLEKTYPALETLTEPHRLIASLNCTVGVARAMLSSHKWYPEGRTHVLPLLNLSLPGIDPNDIRKCLTTFQLISTLVSLVPLVDCSGAINSRPDLDETERELCCATAQFEDFVMLFLDRLFTLTENSSGQFYGRPDAGLNHEEAMMEVGLLSTVNVVMQQASPALFDEALRKMFRFVSGSFFDIRVAGRYAADMCRAAAKANPEKALKLFVPHFCRILKARLSHDDVAKEEHLDNEILWNLKLLSEVVRCNGVALLPHKKSLVEVLELTLHLKCQEAADLGNNLLKHVLKAQTLIYNIDYRSCPMPLDDTDDFLPIKEWGQPGNINDLQLKWHVASDEEKAFASELLEKFLGGELDRINKHINGEEMTREELVQCLKIVFNCISGAGSELPIWAGEQVQLVESVIELKRYNFEAGSDAQGLHIRGQNVRQLIVDTVRPLLDYMLANGEDDTKSLNQLIKVLGSVMFYQGTLRDDFDGRWKSLHVVKKSMENMLLGKKKHIRAVLVDRVQLQHELRVINRNAKVYTPKHRDLFKDLFRLAVSRYSEVRKSAQQVLNQGFNIYSYSYRSILTDVLGYLKADPEIEHHQFKGALHVVLGEQKRSLMTKRSWEVMGRVWPALIQAPHSEKPSIVRLIEGILDKLYKNMEATELSIKVPDSVIQTADSIWKGTVPQPSIDRASLTELQKGKEAETLRNEKTLRDYLFLINELVRILEPANLHWRYQQIGTEMLLYLTRHDILTPEGAVRLFAKNLISDSLKMRKIGICAVSAVLKQQKRPHAKEVFDPYAMAGCERPRPGERVPMGIRDDNKWLQYTKKDNVFESQETWDKCTFIDKTHWGYACWPEVMYKYAPADKQPPLGRNLEEVRMEEKPILEFFLDSKNVDQLIKYLTLEENKGKDKFSSSTFLLWKGLFRSFDDTVLPHLKPHVEQLLADTQHDTHEISQRCALEIIAGMIRGCKHWTYSKMKAMWEWVVPILRSALNNITVESIGDWGTCFATAFESRDPRKLGPLIELLLEDPLEGGGGSFGDSSRLYVLQGALAQQEWRVAESLHSLFKYLSPYLTHPYKNVRDRLGSFLVNLYMYDFPYKYGTQTNCPRVTSFIELVLPELQILKQPYSENSENSNGRKPGSSKTDSAKTQDERKVQNLEMVALEKSTHTEESSTDSAELESKDVPKNSSNSSSVDGNGESEERKTAVKLCKTVMKWLQGSHTRMFRTCWPEFYEFLPILCQLESETKDDELRTEGLHCLAYMAQSLVDPTNVPHLLDSVKQVLELDSWHARTVILGYLQIMVFSNLFLMSPYTKTIHAMVVGLLCDEQVEVRDMAAVTLSGLLHCGFLALDKEMLMHFQQLSRTKIKRKKQADGLRPELLIKRHAGVLGLSACVQAFPYDVPEVIPQILMELSNHLDDPQPVQLTVKKTLSNFKRTHYDNWQDHKQKFTDDQLVVLTDLLVSPSYYA